MLQRELQALFDRGCEAHAARRFDVAEECFRLVLKRAPRDPKTLGNLAEVLRAAGKLEDALAAFSAALEVSPNDALIRSNRASALLQLGRTQDAILELEQALTLDPKLHRASNNLANALLRSGRLEEAKQLLTQVIAALPTSWPAHASLGAVLLQQGQPEAAAPHLMKALELEPRAAEARAALAGCLASLGFVDEALAHYRGALQLLPDRFDVGSPYLFTLHHGAGNTPELLFAEAKRLGAALETSLASQRSSLHANDWDTNRRLRIGYVSPDLRRHPVGFFLAPVLEAHDREAFEIFAYSDTRARDAMNERLRKAVPCFRDTADLGDAELSQQIRDDRIDLLIDLAGHTTGNRLQVFARKPAPLQLTWLGYPDTTGLASIDYRIIDSITDPPGAADALHTEELLRLPHCFIAWDTANPRSPAPSRVLPALAHGAITFGCFNNLAKLSAKLASRWAQILIETQGSRLLLKSRGLTIREARERVIGWFTQAGVAADRIVLLPFGASPEEGLGDYARVDLALDPFPYNGTTTTCEALSMGAPLLALRGQSHAGRVSASILESLDLPELIAESEGDYVRRALALANDRDRLAQLRRELPERFSRAPVGDPKRLARELEAAFREVWQARATAATRFQ
jgi:protein O-GlcNAc transferase